MKRNVKSLLIASVLMFSAASVFAADATVTFIKGKVEVLKGTEWVPLNKGDELKKSDVINTGFQSEAKIKLFDSVMYLGPVTRISLDELSATDKTDKVSVYLKTGNVRSQVNHTESKRVNYQVSTAVAVASVRGTGFEMDDSNTVSVFEGAVATAPVKALTAAAASNMAEDVAVPDDAVVLAANQTLTISEDNFTNTPVNTVVQAASDIVSAVSTAASEEAVTTTTSAVTSAVIAPTTESAPVAEVQTGNVIIKVSF